MFFKTDRKIVTTTILLVSLWLTAISQVKKHLKPEDYHCWHSMSSEKISDNGKWVSFQLNYDLSADTTIVRSVEGNKPPYIFPMGRDAAFSPGGGWFACMVKENRLCLVQLKTGRTQWLPNVSKYAFTATGEYLTVLTIADQTSVLALIPLKNGPAQTFPGIKEYSINASGNAIACITNDTRQSVHLLRFDGTWTKQQLSHDDASNYSMISWQSRGNALTYVEETQKQQLWYYHLSNAAPEPMPALPEGWKTAAYRPILISEDGRRVFLYLQPPPAAVAKNSVVQVWNVKDPWIYPQQQLAAGFAQVPKLFMWRPSSDRYTPITDNDHSEIMLSRDQQVALVYSLLPDAPQFTQVEAVDVYLLNLETGKRQLLIPKAEHGVYNAVNFSPGGNFIAYYHGQNWWLYDLQKNIHKNLTEGMGLKWETDFGTSEGDGSAFQYGIAGWTLNDSAIIVYDQYDCWLITLDGQKRKKLTNGCEQHIRYRIQDTELGLRTSRPQPAIDLSRDLVLEAKGDDRSSGYLLLRPDGNLQSMVYGPKKHQLLKAARDKDIYIYRQETFESAPALMSMAKADKSKRTLWQTNKQQSAFEWGRASLIQYCDSKGDSLRAALIYPAGYIAGRKYPMIVNIYQQKSGEAYDYQNPSMFSAAGLNTTLFATEGYLILLPDINYTVGNTGMSAVDCVEAAVKAVIRKGIVNEAQIGLTGHSFGGYETSFIVTQSKLFAAAISGASTDDLVKSYFTMNDYSFTPNLWRYEMQQMRMGFNFYDNQAAYLRNSPIHQAANITTPLLLWTGEEDHNVQTQQSIEFYLALRRLQKESTLLVYPQEGHILDSRERQHDLTMRMLQWFDHYLKGAPPADWISGNHPVK